MADFSRLPNEMISEIWSKIDGPEDVESFALVSKHVYAIGRPFVKEHNKLKKEFSFVGIGFYPNYVLPASLLKKVLLRPRVALYVRHLSIGRLRQFWDDESDDDGWPKQAHVPYPDDVMALFIKTIRQSSFVPRTEKYRWIPRLKIGDENPILALLCMLLPNISMVTLREDGSNARMSQETIQRIAEAEKPMFLTRLVSVNIEGIPEDREIELEWLRAFALLPFVQSIHCAEMGVGEVDLTEDKQYFVPESCSVRQLTFASCGLPPKLLAQFLVSVKGLKIFSYFDPDESFCEFKPFWIRTALLANAKHSLKYLTIVRLSTDDTKKYELLGSLRGFTALTELETNVNLLCRGSAFDELADPLPRSIEKLYLHSRDCMAHSIVPSIVEEVVKAKSRPIPNLKALQLTMQPMYRHLEGNRSMIGSLKEKCQKVGIELTII